MLRHDGPLARTDTGARARVRVERARQGHVYRRGAAMRRRGSHAVALAVDHLGNPFFAEFVAGVDFALVGSDDIREAVMPPSLLATIAAAPCGRGIEVARPVSTRLRGEASSRPRTVIAPAELRVGASSRDGSALEQIPRGAAA